MDEDYQLFDRTTNEPFEVFTNDKNALVAPDILGDVLEDETWRSLTPHVFDIIVGEFCYCHTAYLMRKEHLTVFMNRMEWLLKPNGIFYMTGVNMLSYERLEEQHILQHSSPLLHPVHTPEDKEANFWRFKKEDDNNSSSNNV